jgi:hypothetical protein
VSVFLCKNQAARFILFVGEKANAGVVLFFGFDQPGRITLSPAIPNATAQNIKKIALLMSRKGSNTPLTTLLRCWDAYHAQLPRYQALDKASSTRG